MVTTLVRFSLARVRPWWRFGRRSRNLGCENRQCRRVGGKETIHVDIRVIAATNRDLKAAIAAKAFREDLYFRVKQLFIKVPALRERRGDIALLARHNCSRPVKDPTTSRC